jgi:inhibitor of cysteine peptidase
MRLIHRLADHRAALLLVTALYLAPAPLRAATQRAPEKFVAVEQKPSGSLVSIARGATLELRLATPSGTGCTWKIAENDPGRLVPMEQSPSLHPAASQPGASGHQEFRFLAKTDGETALTLNCVRPSEQSAGPAKTYRLTVNIVTAGALAHQRIVVTDAEQASVRIVRGTLLTVSLPANPSTGYTWQIASGASQLLQPVLGPVYLPPANALPGAGGYQEFLLQAERTGTATLRMAYRRPFESGTAPAKTFTLSVSIHR